MEIEKLGEGKSHAEKRVLLSMPVHADFVFFPHFRPYPLIPETS